MPLTLANPGEENIIRKIGGKPEVKKHLENLGFVAGGNVTVISATGGNVIVNVKESRVAINVPLSMTYMQRGTAMGWAGKLLQKISSDRGGNPMKTLREAKIGDTVTVVKLHGEGAVKRRIMDMGITKGVTVHIRKVAPLGDPVEITVRGYELSLRKADAGMVEVE